MGVIKQGLLGGFSNKVGPVVGTSWKGIAVVKSKPISVANPRTTPQINQRTKFAAVVAFASTINSAIIKPLWDRFAQRKSGNNAFVQANIDFFNNSGVLSAPESLKISEGKIAATAITSANADISASEVLISWSTNLTNPFQAADDVAYAVAYNATTGKIAVQTNLVVRDDGITNVTMPVAAGNVIHCWLAFRRADNTLVSDTSYRLATVVA
jgi:hypothetical protein